MNIIRTYSNKGKTLQELMETLLPILIQEKTCKKDENSKITCYQQNMERNKKYECRYKYNR